MSVAAAGRSVHVRVPATSANLGPGFDTLGLALSVYDELDVTALAPGELEIEVTGTGADDIPRDDSHLIVRTIRHCFDAVGRTAPGLRIVARNGIPHGKGMGSSGAAVAAGVLAAKGCWRATSTSTTRRCCGSRPRSRATPTTSPQPCSAA